MAIHSLDSFSVLIVQSLCEIPSKFILVISSTKNTPHSTAPRKVKVKSFFLVWKQVNGLYKYLSRAWIETAKTSVFSAPMHQLVIVLIRISLVWIQTLYRIINFNNYNLTILLSNYKITTLLLYN